MEIETYTEIQLGKATEEFLLTEIGIRILDRAESDRAKAMREFAFINPSDAQAVAKCQEDYNTPNKVLMWLNSVIEEGKAKLLEEEAREEFSQ